MLVKDQSLFVENIAVFLQQLAKQPRSSVINYQNDRFDCCTFVGLNPIGSFTVNSNGLDTIINQPWPQAKGPVVYAIATTYEWGVAQLGQFSHRGSADAYVMVYDSGYWVHHATRQATPFGDVSPINQMVSHDAFMPVNVVPTVHSNWFHSAIDTAKIAIKEGDMYQVNVSYPCIVEGPQSCRDVFCWLIDQYMPSTASFMDADGCMIASFSPEELFYAVNHTIRTRPIKGTIARGATPDDDQVALAKLQASDKDRAELIMITDLLRNDLGRCCAIGTVVVDQLCHVQSYEYVHHMASIITGRLKPHLTPFDALKYLAPGGSITGCPKHAACQQIDAIEVGPRSIYTGHIGFVSMTGESAMNVAIRTCYQHDGHPIMTHTGCGITIDSIPEEEYKESIEKLRFITNYVQSMH